MTEVKNNWQEAKPVDYLDPHRRVGKCLPAVSQGPPLQMRAATVDEDATALYIELEDCEKQAARRGGIEEQDILLRLGLKLPGARRLCCQMLYALAACGDSMAKALVPRVKELLDEFRNREPDPGVPE